MDFFKLNQIMNEQLGDFAIKKSPEMVKYIQSQQHVVERSGLPADKRYFIGWKKDLPSHKADDVFADGQYGSFTDAVRFPSKDAAEDAAARIKIKDGYNVYATPLGEPDDPAQHPVFDRS